MLSLRRVACWLMALGFCASGAPGAAEGTFDPARTASKAVGRGPDGALVRAPDGSFYGTNFYGGGPYDAGGIFEVTPDGMVRALATFTGYNGRNPIGGLVRAADGNLYGITQSGEYNAASFNGAIFRINPVDRVLITIATLDPAISGYAPQAGLTLGSDGNLYGTTTAGGEAGRGTIFRSTVTGELTSLASFSSQVGFSPEGRLLEGSDGSFCGTTTRGGANDAGTVFRLTSAGQLTVLASFAITDTGTPLAIGNLVQDAAGDLYGVTESGGSSRNGTIFKVTTAGVLSTVFSFDRTRGAYPHAGMVAAGDGTFYGATSQGGAGNYGVVYHLLGDGTVTRVLSFDGLIAEGGRGELLPAGDGSYFATTYEGGAYHDGAVIHISPDGGSELLASFVRPDEALLNLSTRGLVKPGDQALIAGFIIGGEAKRVIVRALGPSVQAKPGESVLDTLKDPTLELHDASGQLLATNDNWRDTQETAIAASGLAPSEKEAAVILDLVAGAYTAVVRGKDDGSGIALVEVYDLDRKAQSALANISTRGFVGTDNSVLIGGFIVTEGTGRLVVRALGPSVGQAGVQGVLQDPNVTVYDANGFERGYNDNWRIAQPYRDVPLALAPANDLEAALVLDYFLEGTYTAVVRGNGGSTGIALLETYNVQ